MIYNFNNFNETEKMLIKYALEEFYQQRIKKSTNKKYKFIVNNLISDLK